MTFVTLLLTALGLSMDAFAVAITSGILISNLQFKNAIKIGLFFGFFQGFMPLLGWLAGINFSAYIVRFDHWIAFVVLSFIGLKMIYESMKEEADESNFNPLDNKVLFLLALATSIDALAVGVSFAFLQVSIIYSIVVIAIITFFVSALGVLIGKKSGELLKKRAEIAGGLILTFIGTKILLEHLNFNVATVLRILNLY